METAFELGKGQLDLSKIPESDTPKLLVRYGATATEIIIQSASAKNEGGPKDPNDTDGRSGSNSIHAENSTIGVLGNKVHLPHATFTLKK